MRPLVLAAAVLLLACSGDSVLNVYGSPSASSSSSSAASSSSTSSASSSSGGGAGGGGAGTSSSSSSASSSSGGGMGGAAPECSPAKCEQVCAAMGPGYTGTCPDAGPACQCSPPASSSSSSSSSSGAGGGPVCNTTINDGALGPSACVFGGDQTAFQFTPATMMPLAAIEIPIVQHPGMGAAVAVYDDAGGQPGTMPMLFLFQSIAGMWAHYVPQNPTTLAAGKIYWIAVVPNADEVLCAAQGSPIPWWYRAGGAGAWLYDGPNPPPLKFAARVLCM